MKTAKMFKRKLDMSLFKGSTFLLGPRKVGKSTFLHENFPNSLYIDLLDNNKYFEFTKNPGSFNENIQYELNKNKELRKYPIIIDEIQRIPILLNEVHRLIEKENLNFILCGSSARKLVRGGANMLGGRASRVVMGGLCIAEIDNFNLLRFINNGNIPSNYLSNDASSLQKAYIQNYIQEEIKGEALVRNLLSFNRFLDLVGITNGEEVNFSNISRDVGVDAKTIREYFQILIDTLLGNYLLPYFDKKKRTNILQSPKFYLFDTGIVNSLKGLILSKDEGSEFGKSFEQIILNEIINYKNYKNKNFEISFWRTYEKDEVDFILGDAEVSIEVKGGKNIDSANLKGTYKFNEVYKPKRSIVITNTKNPRKLNNETELIPYLEFVNLLWEGKII